MKLGKAFMIASRVHEAQVDKAGKPYIYHPVRVSMNSILSTEDEHVVAALHDTVEDGGDDITILSLIKAGLTPVQATALDNITRRDGESWDNYVGRVVTHIISVKVKIADLEDNMDVKRLATFHHKDKMRTARYHSLWIYLQRILAEREW